MNIQSFQTESKSLRFRSSECRSKRNLFFLFNDTNQRFVHFGKVLHFCPIICIDYNGTLTLLAIVLPSPKGGVRSTTLPIKNGQVDLVQSCQLIRSSEQKTVNTINRPITIAITLLPDLKLLFTSSRDASSSSSLHQYSSRCAILNMVKHIHSDLKKAFKSGHEQGAIERAMAIAPKSKTSARVLDSRPNVSSSSSSSSTTTLMD